MHLVHIQCLLRVDGSILAGVFLTSFVLCLSLHIPPLPASLLSYYFQKKSNRNKSQKVFRMRTSAHRDGTLKKPAKQDENDTTTCMFTPSPHLVLFCQLCTTQNSLNTLTK